MHSCTKHAEMLTKNKCFILNIFLKVWILNCIHSSLGANILAIMSVSMRSHLNAFAAVIEQLAPYHNITFLVGSELKYKYPNVTTIDIPAQTMKQAITDNKILENPCKIDYFDLYYYHVLHEKLDYYTRAFSNDNFQKLLRSKEKFDVLIISSYASDLYALLAHKFNVPIIQVSPSMLMPWTSLDAENPMYWDNDYSFFIDEHTHTFLARITKYIKNYTMMKRYNSATLSIINEMSKKYVPGSPPVQDILKNTDLVFANLHSSMGFPRTTVPTVVQVGGMHVKPSKKLPKDLEEFISSAGEHGFIYFSLGTFITDSKLHPDILKSMLNVFRKLKQNILWKWDGDLENVPPNVKISKWFPQIDLLGHEHVKLFITQGGMLSLLESCSFGVPSLLMPAIFDQKINAYLATKLGYGLTFSLCDFTEDLFYEKINDLIYNSTYKQQVMQISQVMQHDRKNIREKINFWVDFVIKNKGRSILKKSIPYIPWSQTMSVDIFLMFSLITICFLILTSYTIFNFFKYFNIENKMKIN